MKTRVFQEEQFEIFEKFALNIKLVGRERVLERKKFPITSVKLFGMEKVSGITKKNFKIGTLEDFEKMYVLYVAMAEKPLSSGQKWFLR